MDPEQVKQLISLLQSMLVSSQNASSGDDTPDALERKKTNVDPATPRSNIKTRTRKKVSGSKNEPTTQQSNNKFESMSEFVMHKEDTELDKKLCKAPPVARLRDFEFVDVTCRICGKTENVAPSLVFDSPSRYKCNNCSTQSG
jgi:hypothetical protein